MKGEDVMPGRLVGGRAGGHGKGRFGAQSAYPVCDTHVQTHLSLNVLWENYNVQAVPKW
jgi:hypothetical protein